jgi:hypothetical protein
MEMGAGGPPGPGGQYPGQQPPPGQPPTQQGRYSQQPGGGAAQAMQGVQRAIRTPETKPFFLTSEFLVWVLVVVGVAIAGAVVGDDNGDDLPASLVWILITVISLAYVISRGISKAGTKYPREGGAAGGGY